VIISPHGAQLTNLIFARPCTVVVELYPRHYFMPGFYLSLAAQVGALPSAPARSKGGDAVESGTA